MRACLNGSVLIGLGLALVAGLSGCSTNPSTGRSRLNLGTDAQAVQMGIQAAPQLVQEFGGEVPNADLRNYVNEVGMRLKEHTETDGPQRQWRFYLLDSDVINAFALPGEQVFMSRGLADKMTNEAQLAGVLGHEIGHVMAEHSSERMSQGTLGQIGAGVIGIFGGGSTTGDLVVQGGQVFIGGTLMKFSRDQESEADSLGMRYMSKAGYNPRGQLQVMEILDRESNGGGGTPEILATHPLPKTRIDRVSSELRTTYANTQSGPEASRYQFFDERFQQRYLSIARTVPVKKSQPKAGVDAAGRTRLLASVTPGVVWEDPMTWCALCQGRVAH